MKNWIKIFAFAAFSTQAFAQQSFTIDDAVKYALENNVNIKKAKIKNKDTQIKKNDSMQAQTSHPPTKHITKQYHIIS